MVCFVLLGFIQVYSVFRVLHIHSISRVKNELNPFPSTALYLSLSMPIVKDAPDWYWIVCLSSLEASSYLWTISADCLSLESSQIPCLLHPAQCTNRNKMVTYSVWQDINQFEPPRTWANMLIAQIRRLDYESDSCNKTCNLHIEL